MSAGKDDVHVKQQPPDHKPGSTEEWEDLMLAALKADRVDDVEKLLEMNKGPPDLTLPTVKRFLTKRRLNELYISENDPAIKTQSFVLNACSHQSAEITLQEVDSAINNKYMSGSYHCTNYSQRDDSVLFPQPFNELLIWSVLTKRHAMAKLMWQNGEEALAKALVASKLYQAIAIEAKAEGNLTEFEIDNLLFNALEFEREALALLDCCYRQDAHFAQHLLAREMPNWSNQTCLDLAYACEHRKLLAHSCSQLLLLNLWLGGLAIRMRDSSIVQFCKYDLLRLLLAFFVFPLIPCIVKFKAKEDIQRLHLFSGRRRRNGQNQQSAELTYFRKITLFFTAPIVKFDFWSMAYMFFLLLFSYTILIKTPATPQWNECYVIAYLATFGVEKMREILSSRLKRKFGVWCSNEWNVCDVFFIVTFFIGVGLRMMENTLDYGRVLYSLNIVYWYIRIVVILRVSIFFGPFITMIGLMLKKLTRYVVLLLVVLMSYGVFRQSLLFPNEEEFSWMIIRDIFFKPYFMIYGELFIDDVSAPCGNGTREDGSFDPEMLPCATGSWLNPLLMILYLLVANILVVNLLISVFNSIFQQVEENSDEIWKINQYAVVMEYKEKPVLPPPFVIFSHLYLVLKCCFRWMRLAKKRTTRTRSFGAMKKTKRLTDFKLSIRLVGRDLESVYKLEQIAMERLLREKKAISSTQDKADERFQLIDKRLEELSSKMKEIHSLLLDLPLLKTPTHLEKEINRYSRGEALSSIAPVSSVAD